MTVLATWTQDRNSTDRREFIMVSCGQQAFEKGESITIRYEVWDDYVADGYLPAGTYRFDVTISLWDSVDDESDPRLVDWWVELEVTTPATGDTGSVAVESKGST